MKTQRIGLCRSDKFNEKIKKWKVSEEIKKWKEISEQTIPYSALGNKDQQYRKQGKSRENTARRSNMCLNEVQGGEDRE